VSKFNLLFAGEINEDYELEVVQNNFQEFFHLTDVQTKYIFSGKEIILKKNLTQEKALEYALKIDEIGGISYFIPVTAELNLPPGVFKDRRIAERRKRSDRRNGYRAGISADRRMKADRRKKPD